MSEIAVFQNAGLPAVTSLSSALKSIAKEADALGTAILKMDKTGHWVVGADQTEVEDDSKWAINPFSFVQGFIAWGEGEVLGEVMTPVTQPLPDPGVAPAGAKKGWETQIGLSVKCISGEDAGLEARYSATSVGGKKAVQALAAAIAEQVDKNPEKPVPVVRLKREHYQHKQFGRIYTPVFEVVEWVSMNGEAAAEPAAEAEEAPASGRRRRSV